MSTTTHGTFTARAYAAASATSPLAPATIARRTPGPHDVQLEVLFCGVCHSDLHQVRSEWAGTLYPCVPGHEIVGRVTAVGEHVSKFREGDIVGVGCMVDSYKACASCEEGLEQYCETGFVGTYNGPTRDAPGHTLGGSEAGSMHCCRESVWDRYPAQSARRCSLRPG